MSFAQLDGESDVDVNGQEKEEGANELGQPVGPEGAPCAGAQVGAADAVDDSRRGYLREYRRLRQLIEKLYRVAKDKYEKDGDYEKFRKVEKTFEEEVTKLDLKFPGLF